MKLRWKIAIALAGVMAGMVIAGAVAISYDEACSAPPSATPGEETMRAVAYTCYGGPEVLAVTDIDRPEPGPGQVRVRVHRAGVNPLDWHFMRGEPYFMRMMSGMGAPKQQVLGVDFAGTVDALGAGVTRFAVGDRVFGGKFGAFADYLVMDADGAVAAMPPALDFDQAAGFSIAAQTALQALRDQAQVQPGQRVLINGASGGVGTFAVQIAKAMGAEVTGVCSGRNADMVRGLGADEVIDYKQADYTESGQRWDVIVDMVGNHGVMANHGVLTENGAYVIVGGSQGRWFAGMLQPLVAMMVGPFVGQRMGTLFARQSREDLETLATMAGEHGLRAVIDRHYPLAEAAEAISYSETGRARGKILLDIAD